MQQPGFVFVCVLMTTVLVHTFGQDLRVTVTPARTEFDDKQDVDVVLNYKNTGSKKVLVYKWYVPDQALADPLFDVTRDGKHVEYVGPLVKRRAPLAEDMIPLEPGKTMSARVRLSAVYNMTVTGNYAVRVNVSIGSMLSASARLLNAADSSSSSSDVISNATLVSPPATLFAVGRTNAILEEGAKVASQPRATTYTFYGCTSSRQTTIITALRSAASYTSSTIQYLSSVTSPGTTRYTTWFGTYSLSNLVTLRTHFTRIQDVFNTKSMAFDCSCTQTGTFAYVYPYTPYKIYLCPGFWAAPTTGTDTKGGTLVHETSHFAVVAGTSDLAYGQAACKNLAKTSPTRALNNADSHEYFTENNPVLR